MINLIRHVVAQYFLKVALFVAPKDMKRFILRGLLPALEAYGDHLKKEFKSPRKAQKDE